ncbi:hypothetical protein FOA52_004622 [Chlamydomonas sp. UWO 241]|nr:hypothetical protein FOA52_004622 [Chlamydomonas sp. UWO 241]
MGKKTKLGKGRQDKFYHLAKEQGFRSRAAFKLIQLNRKYDFLSSCNAMLDLCAAPGGWLQVAAKAMPLTSIIIGVDLVPIKPIRGVKTMVHDITTQACRTALKKEAKGTKFDCVVHDGAPNVGGAWANEAYTQSALVLDSLRLATEFLTPGGTLVTKIFRSKDYNALLYGFNQLFNKVESTKPTASRNTSAEIFVVCQGYKAPAKIDPRLLDPKHLFADVTDAPRIMGPESLLKDKIKQTRHREGYEDGISTTFKVASALAFITSDTHVEMLGKMTRLAIDGPQSWEGVEGVANAKEVAEAVRAHASTDREIRQLVGDLQVLGRSEFKQLLRWRLVLRKALTADGLLQVEDEKKKGAHAKDKTKGDRPAAAAAGQGEDAGEGEGEEKDPEAELLKEMEEVKARMEARQKREKKNRREMKKKSKVRLLSMAGAMSAGDDSMAQDEGLFNLGQLKPSKSDARGLARLINVSAPGDEDMAAMEEDDDTAARGGHSDGSDESDLDSDEEALRYEAELEDDLDQSYVEYLQRQGHRDALAVEKRKRLGSGGELGSDDEDGEGVNPAAAATAERSDDDEGEAGGGLLVSLDVGRAGVARTGAAAAQQWFDQDMFADADIDGGDDDEEEEEEEEDARPAAKRARTEGAAGGAGAAKRGRPAATRAAEDEDEEVGGSDGDDDEDGGVVGGGGSSRGASGSGRGVGSAGRDGFEIVPLEKDKAGGEGSDGGSETDSEDEFDMLDDQGKAEVLALAKRMLRRKEKESIVDAAYNRWSSHDVGLPRWFEDDESKHRRPIATVTKDEVRMEKERLKAIDARPIKKIAEAKGRKRMRLAKNLSSARAQAEAVANQDDVPAAQKAREIEKLYARAHSGGKKGKKGPGGKSNQPFDQRLKKDLSDAKRRGKKTGGRKEKAAFKAKSGGGARGGKGGGKGGGKR